MTVRDIHARVWVRFREVTGTAAMEPLQSQAAVKRQLGREGYFDVLRRARADVLDQVDPVVLKRGPKYPLRPENYDEPDPKRRLVAARTAVKREWAKHRKTWGMLADVVEGPQETPEARVERYGRVTRAESCQRQRDRLAGEWREVRALFRSRPREAREKIAERWNIGGDINVGRRDPSYLRYLVHEISPPPAEVERRRRVREEAIAFERSRPSWIEHVQCGPLRASIGFPGWTCLGCGWVIRRGDPKAVEAAQKGELEYRYAEGYAVQESLQLEPVS